MFPNAEIALQELKRAGEFNPGPWVKHSANVAAAAKIIAGASGLNPEKAFVCGLLHDIGRRQRLLHFGKTVCRYHPALRNFCFYSRPLEQDL